MQINNDTVINITGGCGYIGANLVKYLNKQGITNINIFEYGDWTKKWKNLIGLKYNDIFDRDKIFYQWPTKNEKNIVIVSLGANSATTSEPSHEIYDQNTIFANRLIDFSIDYGIKLIHASSASVYGSEEQDFTPRVSGLKPINFYAWTKLKTDEYLESLNFPPNIYSLRFFNVWGSKLEQYKGPMSSVIYRWLSQDISTENPITLFKSLRLDIKDGFQQRDFIFIEDICSIIYHCMKTDNKGGIYNAGSGEATTWLDIANTVLEVKKHVFKDDLIKFIDMPEKLRNQYQYKTQSDNTTLREKLGYQEKFTSIQDGIRKTWEEMSKL